MHLLFTFGYLHFHRHSTLFSCTYLDVCHVFLSARPEQDIGSLLTCCFSSCLFQAAVGATTIAPAEQVDPGTGGWRGMLKRGDEGAAGDRATPQSSFPSSPQKGHAVNLLDVVRTLRSRPLALSYCLACSFHYGHVPNIMSLMIFVMCILICLKFADWFIFTSLFQLRGSYLRESRGTVRSSSVSSNHTFLLCAKTFKTGRSNSEIIYLFYKEIIIFFYGILISSLVLLLPLPYLSLAYQKQ